MSKKILKLIKKTRSQLAWPVSEQIQGNVCMITSDHQAHTHLISLPEPNSSPRPIEHLHELGHALLCEKIHPQFSTQYFDNATPEILDRVRPVTQAATDWFIDAWLMSVCPAEERAQIEEHFSLIRRFLRENPTGSPDMFYGAAMVIAQAQKYCGREISTVGKLRQAVGVFLSVDPARPTVFALATLLNRLLAVFYADRVRLEDGAWMCFETEGEPGQPETGVGAPPG